MSVSDKIRALISIRGKKNIDLANYLGISAQSFQNKLFRGSFSSDDLIRIADFLECRLEFVLDDKQSILLDMSDIKDNKQG